MATNQGITITWLGHATTKIEISDGKTILIDPWLETNPSVPDEHKQQDRVDLMLITHAHDDHMGDAISVAQKTKPDVIAIFDLTQYLDHKGVEKTNGINKGGTVDWNGISITMTDAVHSAGLMDGDMPVQGGTAAGFVLRFPDGFTLYFSGDTDLFESMRTIGRFYKPDLAMLPIGDHFTMGPKQAAEAIRMLGVKRVIPIHYATFPLLTGTPEALEREAADISGLRVIALKPGQSIHQSALA
ncbi:MAG: metal-dependent hydrolase [Chloroflexota bacterium]|nr:MAG: metal-dependent hydrolase [Chloroflexota bacterium]